MLRLARATPTRQPLYVALSPALRTRHDPKSDSVVQLNPTVFNHPIRRDVLHLCVVQYRDSLRQGTANTKTRGEVKGSGRKIMQQKGTGKARVGDAQSPIRRGGGIVFGPKPRDFSTKLPRKVIQMGMRVALSAKVKEHSFGVMATMDWPTGRTNFLAQRLKALGMTHTLFVSGEADVGLVRAIKNIPLVKLLTPEQVNVWELIKWPRLVMDLKAIQYFERALRKDVPSAS